MSLHNPISPLRAYYVQKVLPAVYDDSLSYYEILCKVQETLNEVVSTTNEQSAVVLEMQQAIYDFIHGGYTDTFEEYLDEWFEENSDEFVQRLIDEGVIPEVESLQDSLDETIGRLDNLFEITESTFPTKVPFPLSQSEPYYGEIGQVLTTNEDGTTSWNDPVVPSDEQAEQIITTWLNDHPEATTTVQNNSITDPKINENSTIDRFRGTITDADGITALSQISRSGSYFINRAAVENMTDLPSNAPASGKTLLNVVYTVGSSATYSYQILFDSASALVWYRWLLGGGSASAWVQIYPSQSILDNTVSASKILSGAVTDSKINEDSTIDRFRGTVTVEDNITALSQISRSGSYFINRAAVENMTDLPSNAPVSGKTLLNVVYTLTLSATYSYQILFDSTSANVWYRWLVSDSASSWVQIYPTQSILDNTVSTSKISDGAVSASKISDGAVSASKILSGAVTDSKINENSTIDRFRGTITVEDGITALSQISKSGSYFINRAAVENMTDLPENAPASGKTLLNIVYTLGSSATYSYQILFDSSYASVWYRWLLGGGSASAWVQIYPSQSILDNTVSASKIQNGAVTDPKINEDSTIDRFRGTITVEDGITALSQISRSGSYFINRAAVENMTDLPSNAPVSGKTLLNVVYTVTSSATYSYQILFDSSYANVWYRWLLVGSASAWVQMYPQTFTEESKSVLTGKKLVTAGDSYTAALFGSSNPLTGKNFGYYIAQRHSMEFVNAGISGSIMAYDKTYVDDPENVDINTRQPFSYHRYTEIPEDTDYLTLWFGINDASHTYLGTINDTTSDTFYGAWNKVLEYYLTNRPFMHIGIVVTVGSNDNYRNAVREVAAKWGYPVLDLVKGTDTPAFFDRENMSNEARSLRRDAYGYNTWNAHPNPDWHEFISGAFEEFLKRC